LAYKTKEGLFLTKEKTDLAVMVNILEKMGDQEEEMDCKEVELSKIIDTLKDDVTQAYVVGFEAAMEQATIVHPSLNFSELSPCKAVVDGKLIGES